MRLTGSGASFPFPLYSAWFKAFSAKHKGITVDYQGKGSGAGIQDFINRTVDFAASDAAMTDEQIGQVPGGVQLLPMTAARSSSATTCPDPKSSKLPRDVYAGDLPRQDHQVERPKLKAANPGVDAAAISTSRSFDGRTPAAPPSSSPCTSPRSARSGSKGPGAGTTVNWPKSDKFVASPKNDGVTATIKQTPGAIGYIEYAFAKSAKLEMAQLQNKAGQFVACRW